MLYFSINIIQNIIKSVIYDCKSFSIDLITCFRLFNLVILRVMLTIRNIYSSVRVINSIISNSITSNSIKSIKTIKIAMINSQFKVKAVVKINS